MMPNLATMEMLTTRLTLFALGHSVFSYLAQISSIRQAALIAGLFGFTKLDSMPSNRLVISFDSVG
ncbi:MAG: hypothetical protein C0605_07885 [Hyphomicrobiales bacterium]|nr:MAG: hypothetical protein C0605_07885 [Hyphomicrobiales bacterium]